MGLWKELLRQAYVVATKSTDPSTQNGAIVVDVTVGPQIAGMRWYKVLGGDHNRFPKGVVDAPERWNDRELKYKLVHHAERTTLDTVRRTNKLFELDGLTMVCPWAACTDCAKEIIAAGITTLVIHKQAHDRTPRNSVWLLDIVVAHRMLREAGVDIIVYDGSVGGPPVRHSGELWTP